MAARSVVFAPEALEDLRGIYDVIADASLPACAFADVEGIQEACLALATFRERGTIIGGRVPSRGVGGR